MIESEDFRRAGRSAIAMRQPVTLSTPLVWLQVLVLVGGLVFFSPAVARGQTPGTPAPAPSSSPAPAPDDDVPHVNPYGPTITTSATLTNVGLPEYEFFWESDNSSPSYVRQHQTQMLLKYTFAKQWMVNVATNGWVNNMTDVGTTSDWNDPTISLKYNYLPPSEGHSAQSIQLGYKPPFGNPALLVNTGHPDYTLTWFYSRSIGEVGLDVNFSVQNLGGADGSRRLTFNQSAAVTVPLSSNLNYQGEVYHFGGNGPVPSILSTLHAVGWTASPSLAFAAGIDLGLNAPANRINYMVGTIFFLGGGKKPKKVSGLDSFPTSLRAWGR